MRYTIYATGHNGPQDCQPVSIEATTLRSAKQQATRMAGGDRCHISIQDDQGRVVASRDAVDDYNGCCVAGWEPWQ